MRTGQTYFETLRSNFYITYQTDPVIKYVRYLLPYLPFIAGR